MVVFRNMIYPSLTNLVVVQNLSPLLFLRIRIREILIFLIHRRRRRPPPVQRGSVADGNVPSLQRTRMPVFLQLVRMVELVGLPIRLCMRINHIDQPINLKLVTSTIQAVLTTVGKERCRTSPRGPKTAGARRTNPLIIHNGTNVSRTAPVVRLTLLGFHCPVPPCKNAVRRVETCIRLYPVP